MKTTDDTPSLRIVRRFDAPPDTVFDAFTKPDAMRIWWGSGVTFDLDLMVGGRWTIVRRADGIEYTATGEYLEIEHPTRLVYSYAMPQFSPNSDIISIEITKDDGGSIVTFLQSGEDIVKELKETPPGERSASEAGWQEGFDLMEAAWK